MGRRGGKLQHMPYIEVDTNVVPTDSAAFRDRLIEVAAASLGKSPGIFSASISKKELSFKGSTDPAAIIRVTQLPAADELVKTMVAAVTTVAAESLDIAETQVWTVVIDVPTTRWAASGTLMSDRT